MRKVVTYMQLAVSVTALVLLIITGGKLADHNYDIVVEGWIMLVCLSVLFIISVYNLSKQQKHMPADQ